MSENYKEYRDGVLLNDKAPEFRKDCRRTVQERMTPEPHACYCVGPQPGHTKCPCAERAEFDYSGTQGQK